MSLLEQQVIELRRQFQLLKNSQVSITDTQPREPTKQSIWREWSTLKTWDGKNWINTSGGAVLDFTTSVVFSSSSYNSVSWAAGNINIGTDTGVATYAIGAGSFTMTWNTFFYWAPDVPTAIQTTQVSADAITSGGILIAVWQINSDPTAPKASIKTFWNNQNDLITADQIVANAITANKLATTLTYTWNIILSTSGAVKSWKVTYADALAGFWIWSDSGTPKLKIWNWSTQKLDWDGTSLTVLWNITASSATFWYIAPGGAANDVNTNATTISGGKITAYSIDASKINVSTLSAISADIWTISAWTITGVTISSSGATNKIVLSSGNSIDFYYSGSNIGWLYTWAAWIYISGAMNFTANTSVANTLSANGKLKIPVWTNLY